MQLAIWRLSSKIMLCIAVGSVSANSSFKLLFVRDVQCTPVTRDGFVRNLTRISLHPVPEMLESAELYATKYLHTSTDYVAVMVRWELILLEHVYWAHAFKDQNKILEYLQKKGINSTFLATDAGRFGSRVLQPNVSFHA